MIRRPTDQNRPPCLHLYPEEVTTGSRPAEKPLTLKQQVSDRPDKCMHNKCEVNLNPFRGVTFCLCLRLCQEMIWTTSRTRCYSCRRSSSSWETSFLQSRVSFFFSAAWIFAAVAPLASEIDSVLLHHPPESERWRGEQIWTAAGRLSEGGKGRLNGRKEEEV